VSAGFAPYDERQRVLRNVVRPWYAAAG